jgi:hypothetical protein
VPALHLLPAQPLLLPAGRPACSGRRTGARWPGASAWGSALR